MNNSAKAIVMETMEVKNFKGNFQFQSDSFVCEFARHLIIRIA